MRTRSPMPPAREEPDARPEASAETLPLALPGAVAGDAPTRPARRTRARLHAAWRWLRRHLPFVGIFLIAFYLLTINVTAPWQSMHEDNGTLNESIAINHIRFGLGVTKGQDLLDEEARQSFGPQGTSEAQHFAFFRFGPVHPAVYGDHPPLLGLTIAGSFLIFGFHFWSERLVPIAFALLGLLLFYRLVARIFDLGIALVATFLYATFPMLAYFGRNVSHESEVMVWALLLLGGYVRWRERPTRGALAQMVAAIVIGGLYDWPMFYFAPILLGIDTFAERQRGRPRGAKPPRSEQEPLRARTCFIRAFQQFPSISRPSAGRRWRLPNLGINRSLAWATLLPTGITFILVLGQIVWALDGNLTQLSAMFAYRTGGGDHGVIVTTVGWLHQIALWNAEGFGAWSQAAFPVAAWFVAARASAEGWTMRVRVLVSLALWGISHVLIFRNGALVHAYWQFYLLPCYALALAWAAVTLARQHIAAPPWRALALVSAGLVVLCLNLDPILSLYSTGYHVTLPVVPLIDIWH
jgi:hypothetical protein